MFNFVRSAALGLVLISLPVVVVAAEKTYKTEANATKYCKDDPVVWVNKTSQVSHAKGAKNYGKTKNGAYMCQKAADRAGYKPAANGQ